MDEALKVLVLGVGGAGSAVIEILSQRGAQGLAICDTDFRSLETCEIERKILLGSTVLHGLSAGGDAEIGLMAMHQSEGEIETLMKGMDLVFVTGGMGGGTASSALPVICAVAQKCRLPVIAVVFKPYEFEGNMRARQADRALDLLRSCCDGLFVLPHERMALSHGLSEGALEMMESGVLAAADVLQSLDSLLAQHPPSEITRSEILEFMRESCATRMWFGCVEAEGLVKTEDCLRGLQSSPFLRGCDLPGAASKLLMLITGGQSLTLGEIQCALRFLKKHFPFLDPQIASSLDLGFGGRVRILFMVSGAQSELAVPEALPTQGQLDLPESDEPHSVHQENFSFDPPSGGRFKTTETTTYKDQNLDIPTYLRKKIAIRLFTN